MHARIHRSVGLLNAAGPAQNNDLAFAALMTASVFRDERHSADTVPFIANFSADLGRCDKSDRDRRFSETVVHGPSRRTTTIRRAFTPTLDFNKGPSGICNR